MNLNNNFLKKFIDPNISEIEVYNKNSIKTNKNKILINEFNVKADEKFPINLPTMEYFISCYKRCFELIHGIREKKAKKFIEQNINSLEDLSKDKKYADFINNLFKILDKGFKEIKEIFGKRFPSSHKMAFLLLAFFKKEDLLFLDIETKSLFSETQIITIGCGIFDNNNFKTIHFTALNEEGEYDILNEFKKLLDTKKSLITFNGKSFDVPFIDMRMSYYNIENNIQNYHNFDLLFFSKKAFKDYSQSFTLKQIDKNILNKQRNNDINGEDVLYYYNRYQITGNVNFLKPIINHNREDILSIAMLLQKLNSVWTTK